MDSNTKLISKKEKVQKGRLKKLTITVSQSDGSTLEINKYRRESEDGEILAEYNAKYLDDEIYLIMKHNFGM